MKDIDDIRRDNLRIIESECGGASASAALLDMSPSQFMNLRDGAKDSKTGRPRGMRKGTARRIERAAGKPVGWLDIDHSGDGGRASKGLPGYLRLPQLNVAAAAGDGAEPPEYPEVVRWLDVEKIWAEGLFKKRLPHIRVLTARGDSMVGAGINNGDILFVDTEIREFDSDGYYVLSFRGGLQVKRLRANYATNRLEIVSQPGTTESVQVVEPDQEDRLHISGKVAAWWTLKK